MGDTALSLSLKNQSKTSSYNTSRMILSHPKVGINLKNKYNTTSDTLSNYSLSKRLVIQI
tara:strand:- start:1854 stop:2033 length:180 start_codon:yes stop_codon:yes gene_type:complete